jgi:hypothetical protein
VVERVAQYILRTEPRRSPVGLQVGAGAVMVVLAAIVAAFLPVSSSWSRAVPVAVAVFAFALCSVQVRSVAVTTVLGYLLVIGFLVNRFGELSWHGWPDAARLALISGAAGAGRAVGAARSRQLRERPLMVTVYGNSPRWDRPVRFCGAQPWPSRAHRHRVG